MARYEIPEPVEVRDRMLWRDAQRLLSRHAEADPDGRCQWCGGGWPCPPRRLAERAEAAASRPWRESWTARHDLRALPALPADPGWQPLPAWQPEHTLPAWRVGPVP